MMRALTALGLVFLLSACSSGPKAYNVVLITLDTTRSDYVDSGRGARAHTPELKRFAQRAVVFEHAFCTIPQTLPSHLSILTSRLPHECGVVGNEYPYDGRHRMVQEVLKESGYAAAAVISLGTLSSDTGIAGGFDQFLENLNDKSVFFATAEEVTREGIQLLHQLKRERFFLFLHYSDPHSPYAPPNMRAKFSISVDGQTTAECNAYTGAILRKQLAFSGGTHTIRLKVEERPEHFDAFAIRHLKFSKNCSVSFENIEFSKAYYGGSHIMKGEEAVIKVTCRGPASVKMFQVIPLLNWEPAVDNYRREVEYMDRWLGRFLRTLEREKLLKKTIVVVTADHGEGLGERERYFGHVRYLNRQFIQVPLIMHIPGQRAKRIAAPVSLLGISPTLLELLGQEGSGFKMKESLVPVIKGRKPAKKPVVSFAFSPSAQEDKLSVVRWPYQCIFTKENPDTAAEREMYDLVFSQSFRKWDRFSVEVVMRRSRTDYRAMQRAYLRFNDAFIKGKLARANIVDSAAYQKGVEKLRTLGYLQ